MIKHENHLNAWSRTRVHTNKQHDPRYESCQTTSKDSEETTISSTASYVPRWGTAATSEHSEHITHRRHRTPNPWPSTDGRGNARYIYYTQFTSLHYVSRFTSSDAVDQLPHVIILPVPVWVPTVPTTGWMVTPYHGHWHASQRGCRHSGT